MLNNEQLLSHLAVALHPDLPRKQKAELALTPIESRALPNPTPPILHWAEASQQWLWQGQGDRHLLFPLHPQYPSRFLDLKDPPLVLFAQGDLTGLNTPALAMVGSRSASRTGMALARDFACELAQQGWCIVSGLAEGIDGASHQGALDGHGRTIGILGGAIDRLYPRSHQRLAHQMTEQGGLILSEYPPGTDPRPAFFPQRNRLIAALAEATLVVEAAKRSGSLITARQASELGRLVMALPGSIHSPHSKGCHDMIKKGALLVETADEIGQEIRCSLPPERLALLKPLAAGETEHVENPAVELPPAFKALLKHLTGQPVHLDELAGRAQMAVEQALCCLTELELEGWVINEPGNRWVLAKNV